MAATAQEITQQTMEAFLESFNAGDVEGMVSHYAPDAVFINEKGEEVVGTDSIREMATFFMEMKPRLTIDKSLAVAAGDLVSNVTRWTMTGVGPDGKPFETQGAGYDVMQLQSDGTWKMVIDCPWGAAALG